MHYQIHRFPGYLLVHLTVPEIFGVKILPNMSKYTLECSSKTFQNMKFTGSFHLRQIMCRPLSKIADWGPFSQLFAAGPEETETLIWAQATLSSVVTFLPWMNVDTQYFLVFASPFSDFGSVTFLAEVTNSHALWHISCCINLTMHRKSWGPVLCIVRMSTVYGILHIIFFWMFILTHSNWKVYLWLTKNYIHVFFFCCTAQNFIYGE